MGIVAGIILIAVAVFVGTADVKTGAEGKIIACSMLTFGAGVCIGVTTFSYLIARLKRKDKRKPSREPQEQKII